MTWIRNRRILYGGLQEAFTEPEGMEEEGHSIHTLGKRGLLRGYERPLRALEPCLGAEKLLSCLCLRSRTYSCKAAIDFS